MLTTFPVNFLFHKEAETDLLRRSDFRKGRGHASLGPLNALPEKPDSGAFNR